MSDKVLVTTGRIYSKAIAHEAIVTTQGCPNLPLGKAASVEGSL